jgi:histidinol phosphatase-like PHP family hydrolase
MIDLHTHTLLSDGELLPSELARRAQVAGYKAIALTDHADSSNIDFVVPRLVKAAAVLNRYWPIRVIPGVEITHAPLQEIRPLVRFARKNGARIVVAHGETVSEPVIPGTNAVAIEAGCDILAHPGLIAKDDVKAARKKGVRLELTTRKSHSPANRHIFLLSKAIGAELILNTDAHAAGDLISRGQAVRILKKAGLKEADIRAVFRNSERLSAGR